MSLYSSHQNTLVSFQEFFKVFNHYLDDPTKTPTIKEEEENVSAYVCFIYEYQYNVIVYPTLKQKCKIFQMIKYFHFSCSIIKTRKKDK